MSLTLQVLGCGDAFNSGGRLQTCFLLRNGEDPSALPPTLLDCGVNSLAAMKSRGIDPATIRTVLVTHLHGDHFGGLPFLLMDAHYRARRTEPLTLAGPPGLGERLRRAQEVLYPSSSSRQLAFELETVELVEGEPTAVNGLLVLPFQVVHPSGAPSYAFRMEHDGRVLAFSGDTEWTEALILAADNADLFLCECSSYDRRIPNHLNYQEINTQRSRFTCRRFLLTHLGPDMVDRQGLELDVAEEGVVYDV